MRLATYLALYAGGPGSGPRPGMSHDALLSKTGSDKLSPAIQDSLRWYQGGGDKLVNGALRSGKSPEDILDMDSNYVGDSFKDIDEAFSKVAPLTEPITLYRGVSDGFKAKQGEVVTDKGFVSTTVSKAFADKAAKGGTVGSTGGSGRVFAIHVPAGARVVVMNDHNGEQEVLLPRSSKLDFDTDDSAKLKL